MALFYGMHIRFAVEKNNLGKVKSLLGNNVIDKRSYYGDHQVALGHAITENKPEIVTWLLSIGADPNDLFLTKSTGLHVLVESDHIEMAKLLLKKSCNINGLNKWGDTPLHVASFRGDHRMVEFLLINGANINIKDADGKTAFDLAKQKRHKKVIALFDPRIRADKRSSAPTHY